MDELFDNTFHMYRVLVIVGSIFTTNSIRDWYYTVGYCSRSDLFIVFSVNEV